MWVPTSLSLSLALSCEQHCASPKLCVRVCVCGVCMVCVCGVCMVCVWCMNGVFVVYVWCVCGACMVCVWCMYGGMCLLLVSCCALGGELVDTLEELRKPESAPWTAAQVRYCSGTDRGTGTCSSVRDRYLAKRIEHTPPSASTHTTHRHTRTHIHTHNSSALRPYTRARTCTHTHTLSHTHTHLHTHTHEHTRIRTQ